MTKSQKTKTWDILESLARQAKVHIDPSKVQFGDGYFIFEYGKDMVVWFYIDECPGWRFAIWWNVEDKNKFDFFTQFVKEIDKFKPSASTFVVEDRIYQNPGRGLDLEISWDCVKIVNFIRHHRYQAWALDVGYKQDVWEMPPRFKSWWEYVHKWVLEYHFQPFIHKKFTKQYLKIMKAVTNICLVNPEILDGNKDGWTSIPRFHIVCDNFRDKDEKPGHYGLVFKQELQPWLLKKIDRYNKKFEKWNKSFGWFYPFDDVRLGDEVLVTVKRKENNESNGKPVVRERRKSKQSTSKKKGSGKVQQKAEKTKPTKKG